MTKKIESLLRFAKTINVLVVEDNEEARTQTVKLLKNIFTNITTAVDGIDGLEKYKNQSFDLIISDINMPNLNGIEMIERIRTNNKDITIIILSAHNDTSYLMSTIKLGIDGYILKPINLDELLQTLYSSIEKLQLKYEVNMYKQKLEDINNNLEHQVVDRISEIYALNKEIEDTQKEVVFTMGAIGETRSKETGQHVKRVAEYSKLFALKYGLGEKNAELLKQASPMHDIGKVGIPDNILNKPAKYIPEEFEIMKGHSLLGYEMLNSSNRPLLKLAATVAYEHHEKWDGSGYPQGLKGEQINIYGRITAIADVFDALGTSRVYKEAWSDEKIFKLFKEESGKHFDPKLVDIFFDNIDEFLAIRDNFKE